MPACTRPYAVLRWASGIVGPSKMARTLDRSRRMLSSTWSLITSASGLGMNVVTNRSRCSSVTLIRASSFASSTNAAVSSRAPAMTRFASSMRASTFLVCRNVTFRPERLASASPRLIVFQPRTVAQRLEQLVADDVLHDLVAAAGDVQDVAGVRADERLPAVHFRER